MNRILIVADGRSPITRRWIQTLRELNCRISLVSSFPCTPPEGVENLFVIPVAFGDLARTGLSPGAAGGIWRAVRNLIGRFRPIFLAGRYVFGPLSVSKEAKTFLQVVQQVQPDLVHALRIPFEGMLASYLPEDVPLVISIWGNDLTLHGHGSRRMRSLTRRCLERADGLMADAARDIRLGREWGLREGKPTLVVPGCGGLRLEEIRSRRMPVDDLLQESLPDDPGGGFPPIVLNPRGIRPGSLRTDTFFRSIPQLIKMVPQARVVCAAMQGQPEAEAWRRRLALPDCGPGSLRLLPNLPQERLWDLYHRAQVFVSPSVHDGTPNSLLEGMACGCFPVVGDIESMREWIQPGKNGMLVDPADPVRMAEAVALALRSSELRQEAAQANARLVEERAAVGVVREKIEAFYRELVGM